MKCLLLELLNPYKKGINSEDFYDEPKGDDYVYPDR